MDKYYKWKVLLIVAATVFCLWKAYPLQEKINLGLDLQGGIQLLLQVDMDKVPEEARKDVADRVVEIVRNRIDSFGVKEPDISKQGSSQVVVKLPGMTDRDRAKEIVGKTAFLEFRLVSDDMDLLKKASDGQVPEGYEYKKIKSEAGDDMLLVSKEALLTGAHLMTASVGFDNYGGAMVQLSFDDEGAKIFDRATFQNIGKRLAIVLDGTVHSAPVIRDRIPNGRAQITGNFKAAEASDLALVLRAGALPAPVSVVEERTIGPGLGKDSIEKSVKAAIFGVILVFLFMPVYYLLPGVVAAIGLVFYVIFMVGSIAALGATLTLPGIAGFILSVGMAVDANVLISERMREEVVAGKGSRAAISAGYHKAFSAILDSNVTTLITSILLFIFGTGPVQGFAVTLSVGIIASMFSALLVTRVIFDYLSKNNPNLNLRMHQMFKKTNIQFLKGRILAYGFSIITIGIGIAAFMTRGTQNYGVEFTGGTLVQLGFEEAVDVGDLRDALEEEGLKGLTIQSYGEAKDNQVIVKMAGHETSRVEKAVRSVIGEKGCEILRVDQIGPSVSKDLTRKALWAVLWSTVGILIYLAWRFEWKFALAAVVALFHDTIFTFGIYALSGREINLPTIAAVLTIMGYSVNDTIVTFDRVRDNLKLMRKTPFAEIVTLSINQTLSRTFLTSFTTILVTLALFIFGGAGINDFAFAMLVGFGVGIYSTIFVATSLVVDWKAHK
ncbi:MAG: bifunctional preprotein translocase subunit SecD/SecF [Candidatus Omnitrophica bacterium ADurb.Bin292]|jgi:SecD/SecF fusion protein|nr:MAG: bifunctional preprotein translocase subunit SecD/SecF [Candidatus Omnitrophica bacterium ADurb.Bin292]HPW77229.1 protein translocase subunit SecD [Candidatus Omnitrophota bacterium]HQB11424.1 protein translocase subunit SecD [Candidatus Omnitrophota bacterium]